MAKRQNFIVGSTNDNTATLTPTQLNNAWNHNALLESSVLDGTFNAVSDYSNDSSNEIANAIQSITGSEPTGATQTELAGALQQMRDEITTSSLRFVGYVATSAPSASTYALIEGNLWINASAMPTTFPVAASSIKQWNGSSWVNYGSTYTPSNFECWRNVNDTNGYYWFGGQWTVMSTDMSVDYFTLNASGKWEIKSNVNLPGNATTTTQSVSDDSTRIATTAFAHDLIENVLGTLYPVGALYIGAQATCPMSTLMPGTTWTLVSSGRALWTGDGLNANTTIEAGLPALTGALNGIAGHENNVSASGAVSVSKISGLSYTGGGDASYYLAKYDASVNASNSNPIYGNSNTVQPPAYVVNVWRRTA